MVVESTPARRMKLFVRAFKMNFRGTVDIVLPVEGVFVAPKKTYSMEDYKITAL
jgi:hypothetical protein